MWWLIQWLISVVYQSVIDFVLFVIVDSFAKLLIESRSKTETEKKIIWRWESLILAILCILVYLCDHTPCLLVILTVITFVYTQLEGRINIFHWWNVLTTRWEEYQQHQDSMTKMQEQLSEKRRQQEWLLNARNLSKVQGVENQVPPPFPTQHQQMPNTDVILLQRSANLNMGTTPSRPHLQPNNSRWTPVSAFRLSSVFNRFKKDPPPHHNVESSTLDPPVPRMQQEFSFMPKHASKQNEPQNFGTDMDDSPPKKSVWFGDNLARRPIKSSHRIPFTPIKTPDTASLKSKVLTALGVGSHITLPPGIRNEGQNLCFLNSILQCAARTPNLLNELKKESKDNSECSVAESLLISSLTEILDSCSSDSGSRKSVLNSIAFRQAAATLRPDLVALPTQRQNQQDAAEFFMWLMDSVHTVLNKNKKSKSAHGGEKVSARMKMLKFIYGDLNPAKLQDLKRACNQEINDAHGLRSESYAEPIQRLSDLEWLSYKQENDSVVDSTFSGQLVIAYHCLTDNHISVNMQTFNILPVPIVSPREVNGLVMLSDCFTKYCNVEHLVGQDGLECAYCNAERQKQQNEAALGSKMAFLQQQANSASPFTNRTPRMQTRQMRLSSADSAVSGMHSPLPTSYMSPILGCKDFVDDSGFQDNEFKTSTPISDHVFPGQRLRDAERRCMLRQLPDCLVIQLMRFSYNPFTRNPMKVVSPISIPLKNLDLTEIVFDTITNREDLSQEEICYKYDLYGVCCHIGADSTNFGHYVSFCLHGDGKWYKFDDEMVTEVNIEYELTSREVRENAYILFYKKCNL